MNDKCQWKDGKFVSCEDFDWNIIEYNLTNGGKAKKCYHCHADIRKPETGKRKAGIFIVNGEKFEFEYDIKARDLAKMIIEKTNIECTVEIIELEKPLIVKSGGTWIAYFEGVDYLCLKPDDYSILTIRQDLFSIILKKYPDDWKLFTGPDPDITELTDEIAKLRPMVWDKETDKLVGILYGIDENIVILRNYQEYSEDFRLATVHELQETQK